MKRPLILLILGAVALSACSPAQPKSYSDVREPVVRDFRKSADRETVRPTPDTLAPGEFISGNGERCRLQSGSNPTARCRKDGEEIVVSDIISGSH